ncbi:MAG: OmpH family outer membrane protein [bacterium]
MRAFLRAASAALLLVVAASGSAAAQQKFAYIQSSILLDQAPGRSSAESLFTRESAPVQDQIRRMSDSLQAMVAAFEKRAPTLTAVQRDAQGKELQAKQAGYEARARDLEAKQNQRQSELVQPILDRIKLAIEDVRVEGGYSFIFNSDGQGSPIVALDKNLNVTDRVLARLRAGGSTGAKPAAGTPAPAPSGVTRPVTPPLA